MLKHTLAAAALLAASTLAAAAGPNPDPNPFYAGAAIGLRTDYRIDCVAGPECRTHTKRGGKLYAGYSFAPVEAWSGSELTSSIELSTFAAGYAWAGVNTAAGVQQGRAAMRGSALMYKASFRETASLSLHARIGAAYTRATLDYQIGAPAPERAYGLATGLGASYALGRNWALTADVDRVRAQLGAGGKTGVNMYSIGVQYGF